MKSEGATQPNSENPQKNRKGRERIAKKTKKQQWINKKAKKLEHRNRI